MAIEIPNSFVAGAQLKGTATIAVNASQGFDESSFQRVSAGLYGIELTEEINEEHVVSTIVALTAGGAPLIGTAVVSPDHKTLAIKTVDAAGAAADALLIVVGVWLFKTAD